MPFLATINGLNQQTWMYCGLHNWSIFKCQIMSIVYIILCRPTPFMYFTSIKSPLPVIMNIHAAQEPSKTASLISIFRFILDMVWIAVFVLNGTGIELN